MTLPIATLPPRHVLLAVAVMAVWGTNFVVIKSALEHLPPLFFATLRFALVVVPAAFFLRRPNVPWRELAAYGVLIGAGQFGLLYMAIDGRISPGLASLVVQTQVFFTIGLVMFIDGERLKPFQYAALGLAVAGLATIGWHTDGTTTIPGLVLVLLAALSWSLGNLVARCAGRVDMLAYVVWGSMFSAPPLLAMSLLVEGWPAIARGFVEADVWTWLAVAWQSVGNSLFGYAAWGWLLARYPAASVSPMALLVPVFGIAASAFWLGEDLPVWKLTAAALVLGGLAVNLFWPMLARRSS
ncbi:MAG: putative amino-acid metabolite efflux pump [Hyphomicrobiales bacterium]|nr:putative amino-acid metabolite efflux pump [Hyphomicrobiales bacterium]